MPRLDPAPRPRRLADMSRAELEAFLERGHEIRATTLRRVVAAAIAQIHFVRRHPPVPAGVDVADRSAASSIGRLSAAACRARP